MAPLRGQRCQQNDVDESVIMPYIMAAAPHIGPYYSLYSNDLCPLSNFKEVPDDLTAIPLLNGDVVLKLPGGQEASFDVIAFVVSSCLQSPPGFPKAKFPFFRRWIKISAFDEPAFAAAIDASKVLYKFLALRAPNVRPPPQFFASGSDCFRPSAAMLTSLETLPEATPVDIPPLENQASFEAAIRAGHGKYVFSLDNEVLFFGDKELQNGNIIRREISPGTVHVGQIVQVKMCFRLLKQEDDTFVYREMLKSVCVLHDGVSMDIARKVASQSSGSQRRRNREVKFYTLARNNAHSGAEKSG